MSLLTDTQLAKAPELGRKTIMFFIERSTNKNIVVYEAMLDSSKSALAMDGPVDTYWHDIDDEYIKASKAKGKTSTRVELNYIEKKMAYGLTTTEVQPKGCQLQLVALPSKNIDVVLEEVDGVYIPRALTTVAGRRCQLQKIFVEAQNRMIGPPKVVNIVVTGTDVERNDIVTENIKP